MNSTICKLISMAAAFSLCAAVSVAPAQAVTFNVLYTFTGGSDGAGPLAGLTIDRLGNLYGTAQYGGSGYGTAFELKRAGSAWSFEVLYTFTSGNDGSQPVARLLPGPHGHLYSTTSVGGGGGGTVFDLPVSARHIPRKEHSLFAFTNGLYGYQPSSGDVMFDASGNMYGTTNAGGTYNGGTVYELTRSAGKWKEVVLHSFGSGSDGSDPYAGVIADGQGNLYGTTSAGGSAGSGAVYELSPSASGWKETVLYSFLAQNDGSVPYAGLTFDASGNLYGAATDGGVNGGGTVFMLTHTASGWSFNPVYSTPGWGISGPFRTPVVDSYGNIFGTTHCDGAYSQGSVFELTRSGSTWNYTALHDFTGGADGGFVFSPPVFDGHGNIYGTTQIGGSGYGVVWEISP